MKLKYKTLQAYDVKTIDKDQGIVEAIVSVFNNVDSYNERILPGFFKDSLAEKLPKGVWMHRWFEPVAKTLEAYECDPGHPKLPEKIKHLGGLYIQGHFNLKTDRGANAFSDIDFGIIDEFSIGFTIISYTHNKDSGITDLVKGRLYEWSPVLYGANPATAVISAKNIGGVTNPYAELPILTNNEYVWNEAQARARIEAHTGELSVDPTLHGYLLCDIVDGILCLIPDAVLAASGNIALSSDIPTEVRTIIEECINLISDNIDSDTELVVPWNTHSFLGASTAIIASFLSEAKALHERRASEHRQLSDSSVSKIKHLADSIDGLSAELRHLAVPINHETIDVVEVKVNQAKADLLAMRLRLLNLAAG